MRISIPMTRQFVKFIIVVTALFVPRLLRAELLPCSISQFIATQEGSEGDLANQEDETIKLEYKGSSSCTIYGYPSVNAIFSSKNAPRRSAMTYEWPDSEKMILHPGQAAYFLIHIWSSSGGLNDKKCSDMRQVQIGPIQKNPTGNLSFDSLKNSSYIILEFKNPIPTCQLSVSPIYI